MKQNKDIVNNPDAIAINDEFKTPNSCSLTSDEILHYQQRINMQRCSPLGECNDGEAGITGEVEQDVMVDEKDKNKIEKGPDGDKIADANEREKRSNGNHDTNRNN